MIRLMAIGIWAVLCLAAVPAMADSKPFVCVNERTIYPSGPAGRCLVSRSGDPGQARYLASVASYRRVVQQGGRARPLEGHAQPGESLSYRVARRSRKDTQKALDLYQKMIDLDVPQGFYDMGAMIGNRAGVKSPATDGLTFLDKAASLGNPPALTELGKLYIYVAKKDLGLAYTHCAASQGYAPANYELGAYYKIVEHNFPKALVYYQASVSQGQECGFFLSRVFGSETPLQVQCGTPPTKSCEKRIIQSTKA